MRFKAKTKDCRLIVRAKASFGETIDEAAVDAFLRVFLRGFLKAKMIKKNLVEYSGPVAVSLFERLKKPISKRDFLFIMEQLVMAVQKIEASNLRMCHVVLDLHNVYINDVTKEIQFLYVPSSNGGQAADIMGFIENVVYSSIPMDGKDAEFLSNFIYFVKAQNTFSPDALEKYIEKGYVNFKIVGRGLPMEFVKDSYLYFLVKEEERAFIKAKIDKTLSDLMKASQVRR